MAIRMDNAVTLKHADADSCARLLQDYADKQTDHARRTRSAPVRDICERDAAEANRLATLIVAGLWSWK